MTRGHLWAASLIMLSLSFGTSVAPAATPFDGTWNVVVSCTVSLRCEPPFAARRDEGRFCFYGGDEKCPQVQLWTQV